MIDDELVIVCEEDCSCKGSFCTKECDCTDCDCAKELIKEEMEDKKN